MYNQNIKTNYKKEEIFEGILFYHEFIYPCHPVSDYFSLKIQVLFFKMAEKALFDIRNYKRVVSLYLTLITGSFF